jgi:SAM-dependent methyltransferase
VRQLVRRASGFGSSGTQVVRSRSGDAQTFTFDHFNVETERFPYPDDSFDVALFCEILEHLPNDPIHTLCELHRVLRPGGTLVLTTPNATRRENLVRMVRGDNVYEQLSGYGTYGRHNREYTVAELGTLLVSCGWDVERVFAADLHERTDLTLPAAVADAVASGDRGDNLFAVARPRPGAPSWRYPDWLYSSVHALRRLVGPEDGGRADLRPPVERAAPAGGDAGVPSRWMGAAERATCPGGGSARPEPARPSSSWSTASQPRGRGRGDHADGRGGRTSPRLPDRQHVRAVLGAGAARPAAGHGTGSRGRGRAHDRPAAGSPPPWGWARTPASSASPSDGSRSSPPPDRRSQVASERYRSPTGRPWHLPSRTVRR